MTVLQSLPLYSAFSSNGSLALTLRILLQSDSNARAFVELLLQLLLLNAPLLKHVVRKTLQPLLFLRHFL